MGKNSPLKVKGEFETRERKILIRENQKREYIYRWKENLRRKRDRMVRENLRKREKN